MNPPPLAGLRVLELAGLAPGPFAGLLLADFGASVLRIDRAHPKAHSDDSPPPTTDNLVRHKSSVAIDLKSSSGLKLVKALLLQADVLIDPFRPGVLDKIGLSPASLLALNPRLIVAHMTGFRRDGKYAQMAGHDINYLAVSGVLSMLGRKGEKPYAPGNIVGDFAGGGAVCFMGILMALLARERTGKGQVVEANMVDGGAFMAIFPRLAMKKSMWNQPRGENILDGGAPFYDTYKTIDGKFMSVGALEPHFFNALLHGLNIQHSDLSGTQYDRQIWPSMRSLFTQKFLTKTRAHWEQTFDGTDACVAPVLTHNELEAAGYDQRPMVTLRETPGLAISPRGQASAAEPRPAEEGQGNGVKGAGWDEQGLAPGEGGERLLGKWMGWRKGVDYDVESGGLVLLRGASGADSKLRSRL